MAHALTSTWITKAVHGKIFLWLNFRVMSETPFLSVGNSYKTTTAVHSMSTYQLKIQGTDQQTG